MTLYAPGSWLFTEGKNEEKKFRACQQPLFPDCFGEQETVLLKVDYSQW